MGNRIRRFLLCLLAVSTMTVGGNIYADDADGDAAAVTEEDGGTADEESGEEAAAQRAKRSETSEKVELSVEDAEKYLEKIGTIDGLDIYYKDKDIDDKLWEAAGGKPKKKKDYTDEQKELADKIDELKKLGELVAVDPVKGEAVADFNSGSKSGKTEKIYVSDKKRYVLTTDAEGKKLISMYYIVSSIDSEVMYLTKDGDTLVRMKSDHKGVEAQYTYDSTEEGRKVFLDEKGKDMAWLSEDGSHFLGVFRYGAENDMFRMIIDYENVIFGIENKETGYIWWSSPLGATQDTYATDLLVDELRSSSTMVYGIPEKRTADNKLRSGISNDCKMTVSDITNGIRVVYNYEQAGFSYPVEYVLEGDHLKASVKMSELEENNSANIITDLTILGSMGAASDKEDGYFVIPDGSGALVRFNNNRTMNSNAYAQRVYGNDVTAVPATKGAVTEQIYLPCYGIVKEDNALLVVAAKGDSNAVLSAKCSKQSNTSYNLCGFSFTLRGTDTYYMSGNSNQKFTIFERGDVKADDIELLYYPIAKEDADYVDVASRYRQYLIEEMGVETKAEADSAPMYVDLYGGVQKKRPVLGIPITMKTAITTYDQAKEILSRLNESGVDQMVVSYTNWTNDGIKNKVDTDAKPSGTLGGKKDFRDLTGFMEDNDIELYPVSDNRDFYSGNGYFSFTSTAVRVSGSYARIVSYDRAYGIPDGFKKNMSLLSPGYFGDIFDEAADNYSKRGLDGISMANLTTSLYGDYGKKNISRYETMQKLVSGFETLSDKLDDGMLADNANAYALPYVSHITNVPMTSSRFDLFDEDIPFYQLVMHGLIPYSTTAVNGDADSETLLMMAAATGSNLCYDMLYEETSTLKDTEFDIYYYANYENWIDTASEEYKLLAPILRKVSGCTITGYDMENDGNNITTTFSDGSIVKVDFEKRTIDFNGTLYELEVLEKEGGVRF